MKITSKNFEFFCLTEDNWIGQIDFPEWLKWAIKLNLVRICQPCSDQKTVIVSDDSAFFRTYVWLSYNFSSGHVKLASEQDVLSELVFSTLEKNDNLAQLVENLVFEVNFRLKEETKILERKTIDKEWLLGKIQSNILRF